MSSPNGYQSLAEVPTIEETLDTDPHAKLRRAVDEVMEVRDVTRNLEEAPIRFRGELRLPAEDAFHHLRPLFEDEGFTPKLRMEEDTPAIYALQVVYGKEDYGFPTMPVLLLFATILSVFVVGTNSELFVGLLPTLAAQLTGQIPPTVNPDLLPTDVEFRAALANGFLYTISLLGILGAHEMGHYLVARRHKVDTTPPFFIPLPIPPLGTLGAVIAMREPAPNRKVQFDIGIAGPLAGLVLCVPILIIGLMSSEVRTRDEVIEEFPPALLERSDLVEQGIPFIQEGNSIVYLVAKLAVFGEILPQGDRDVWIHPVAFAGWAGLLVTALNLIPVGQLDGGHVLYGLFGSKARQARTPIIILLVILASLGTLQGAAGTLAEAGQLPQALLAPLQGFAELPLPVWGGWWLWVALLYFLARQHAPVLDEITELDPRRRTLGFAMLVIFILIFTPAPLSIEFEPIAAIILSLI